MDRFGEREIRRPAVCLLGALGVVPDASGRPQRPPPWRSPPPRLVRSRARLFGRSFCRHEGQPSWPRGGQPVLARSATATLRICWMAAPTVSMPPAWHASHCSKSCTGFTEPPAPQRGRASGDPPPRTERPGVLVSMWARYQHPGVAHWASPMSTSTGGQRQPSELCVGLREHVTTHSEETLPLRRGVGPPAGRRLCVGGRAWQLCGRAASTAGAPRPWCGGTSGAWPPVPLGLLARFARSGRGGPRVYVLWGEPLPCRHLLSIWHRTCQAR